MKKQNKKLQNTKSIGEKLKIDVICKISNFNMLTAKHLVQASCTELTLKGSRTFTYIAKMGSGVVTKAEQTS